MRVLWRQDVLQSRRRSHDARETGRRRGETRPVEVRGLLGAVSGNARGSSVTAVGRTVVCPGIGGRDESTGEPQGRTEAEKPQEAGGRAAGATKRGRPPARGPPTSGRSCGKALPFRGYERLIISVTMAATVAAWSPLTLSATSSGVLESAGRPLASRPMRVRPRSEERIAGVASVSAQS